ncbi:MAG: hypothetical protein IJK36_10080 [Bacteroidales bacterium]|nr:hypothetical protein [Bacteroidales bacterium]
MIDFFRKYVSFVALILMGLFLLGLINTDKEDLYVMEQTEIQSGMSFDSDEFDDDEDSDFVLNGPSDGLQCRCDLRPITTIGEERSENMCSAALRLGQVRRYAPRKNLADSHNYIVTKNMKDGADFGSDHLFLSDKSTFFFITKAVSEPSLAAFTNLRVCSSLSQF